jgi:hypothetical protein
MPDENEIEDLDLSDIESDADNASEDPFAEETVGRSLNYIIIRPFDPSQIRVETKPMVISLLLDRIKNFEIDLNPGFQREGGIWSTKAKSRLIESLLIRIPLPAFYMDGTDESRWLVVDGLQRLSSLTEFVIKGSLKLRGLEFLSDYEGATFTKLPRRLQRRILETQVTVFLIQEHTPPEVKFNIFKRINTGGLPLSTQEIRHALNQGPATELLQELATDQYFLEATQRGIPSKRMGDRECILRFLAFAVTPPEKYKSYDMDSFLNETMATLNRMTDQGRRDIADRFRHSMEINRTLWGEYAFRKRRPDSSRRAPINRALFEIWSVTIDELKSKDIAPLVERRELLNEKMLEAFADVAFDASISYGTGDSRKVEYRFKKALTVVAETLQ